MLALRQLQRRAEWHGRNLGLTVAGGGLLAAGLGFVVAAIWVALAQTYGAIVASLVLGAVFLGLGLILLALRDRTPAPPLPTLSQQMASMGLVDPLATPRPGQLPPLVGAFVLGVGLYLQLRKRGS